MLLACEPWRQVGLGWGVHQVSSTLNVFFFLLTLFSWCYMPWGSKLPSQLQISRILVVSLFYSWLYSLDDACLGTEAPLTASDLKNFDSFTFLFMTLFTLCCMCWDSKLPSYLQVSRILTISHFFLNLWSWWSSCCVPPSPFRPLSWVTVGARKGGDAVGSPLSFNFSEFLLFDSLVVLALVNFLHIFLEEFSVNFLSFLCMSIISCH